MKLHNTLFIAFKSLGTHPFRSFLAGLGVVFGVGAVVGMLAIGEGARMESIRQIEELGVDKIIIRSIPGRVTSATMVKSGITETDHEHIRTNFTNVKATMPVTRWRGRVASQWNAETENVLAVSDEMLTVTRSKLVDASSRFLTDSDIELAAPVCVLGSRLAEKLFSYRDPLGQNIWVRGEYFTVVGVLHNTADRSLGDMGSVNNFVYIPRTAGLSFWGSPRQDDRTTGRNIDYQMLFITVADVSQIENTSLRLQAYLEATHPESDYEIVLPYQLIEQQEATQRIFTIVMASIASISLLVGGIGIMNIMLANIYERMREIGTRRALGATRADVLTQFLIESVVLTALGGLLGVALGILLAVAVEHYGDMPTRVTPLSILLSSTVSILTGILFGSFPAWKAANLSPIDALRRE